VHDVDYTIVVCLIMAWLIIKMGIVFIIMNNYKMETPSPPVGE
jgi:hypothetical protein